MSSPPFEAGAVQLTVASPLPAVAVTPVGAPGTVVTTPDVDVIKIEQVPGGLPGPPAAAAQLSQRI